MLCLWICPAQEGYRQLITNRSLVQVMKQRVRRLLRISNLLYADCRLRFRRFPQAAAALLLTLCPAEGFIRTVKELLRGLLVLAGQHHTPAAESLNAGRLGHIVEFPADGISLAQHDFLRADMPQNDQELVRVVAAQQIRVPGMTPQDLGKPVDERISDLVAILFVDLLQIVQQ